MPVTSLTSPAKIENEYFDPNRRCPRRRGISGGRVDCCVISPGIEHYIWKSIGVRNRPRENTFGKSLCAKAGFVPIAMEDSEKCVGYSKCVARLDRMIQLHHLRIEPQRP